LGQVRVSTPPRSIRLEDHAFPTIDPDDDPNEVSSPFHGQSRYFSSAGGDRPMTGTMQQSGSAESEAGHVVMSRSDSAVLGSVPRDNLTPWEELQLVRRQVGMTTWSQSYDRNLQHQFCKNLQ
jgi:hypothetical protein